MRRALKSMQKILAEAEIEIDGEWVKQKDCEVVDDLEASKEYGMRMGKWVRKKKD